MVEMLSCSNCHVTFSDVHQLAEHSDGQCECVTSDMDGGQCSSPLVDADDHTVTVNNTPSCAADDSGVESLRRTTNVDERDTQLDTAADDLTEPRLPHSTSTRHSPSFDAYSDNDDDERFDASDNYVLQSQSGVLQFDNVCAAERDATVTGGAEGDVVSGGGVSHSPKTSSSTLTNVSQLIDNNVSPASKIAMLESVVYALHQQQMFQLELIEALRRQLAMALASSSSSSRPADDTTSNSQTLDLTLSRSSDTAGHDQSSSLSSLMRLSAGVDAHRAPPAGLHSPSSSPTTLSESHDPAVSAVWPPELAPNKTHTPAASLPSALLATPKYASALNDLNLFKKGRAPNVTVMRQSDNAAAESGGEDSSSVFKHRCRLCLKVLGSDSALQIHMRSHTGERPYKCNICGNRFTTKGNLKVHFQRHLEQYPNARMNPDPVPEYLDHPDASHGYDRQLAAPAHAVSAAVKSAVSSLRQSATPNMSFVEQTARSLSVSDDSSRTSARENYIGGLSKPSVSESVKMESSMSQQHRHLPESLSVSSVKGDTTQFQSPLSALSSMSSALSAFAPQLRMTFPPPPPPPMSTTPLPVPPGAPVFSPFSMDPAPPTLPPPVTPSKDLDDEDLEQYMEIQQTDTARIEELVREATVGSTGSGKPGDGSTQSDPNECVICHRILSCRSALLMHYRTHTGERPYRCRLCGRTFTTKGNLKTHMAVHRGRISGLAAASAGQHRCRVCRRDFPGAVALQQHIRSAHAPDVTPASNGPFPFPVSGAGGNAAATAAAMMMIPGVSPLLPFFNLSSFYQTPRNLLAGTAGPGPLRTQDSDDYSGRELDLRKSSSVERDAEDRSFPSDVNEYGRPASKRVKTEDGGASSDTSGHWQNNVEMMCNPNSRDGSSSNESPPATSIDETSCNQPVLRGDEVAPNISAEGERGFSVNKDFSMIDFRRRDDLRTNDNIQIPATREEEHFPAVTISSDENSDKFADHIASKFASPLVALEERVNSLDYSMNMFSRFSVAAASVNRDAEDAASSLVGDSCDNEAGDAEQDRSATVQDLRTHDYGLPPNDVDVSYLRADDRQLMSTSPSAQRLLMSGQSNADVGLDDSASSGHSASPGITVRPGSSGSGASSSLSGSALPSPALDVGNAVESPSKISASTPARFSCSVCAKPFASASALEIHSRTHSGDRPFVCHVCSKAFTTKGNLKVHMSTHAWNKCPSRRGRRMTVVDPAAAAAVAAASGAFSGSMSAPKDAATAAAAAAFLSNTFGAGALPPPPMFGGFIPPPPGVAGNGAFLSDNKALVNYCMQAAAHSAGRDSLAFDALRQTASTVGFGGPAPWIVKDERNNNGRTNGDASSAPRVGGELDLSIRSNGSSVGVAASSFGDRQTPPGMRSWTSDRGSSLPLISNCT